MIRTGLAGLLALAAAASPCRAQELGRLFFSPAERDALDAGRREARLATGAPAAPLRIDGYAMRSGGRPTLWINGTASAGPLENGTRFVPQPGQPGELTVAGARRGRAKVKVGGTLDPVSGESRDLIDDGRLRVGR